MSFRGRGGRGGGFGGDRGGLNAAAAAAMAIQNPGARHCGVWACAARRRGLTQAALDSFVKSVCGLPSVVAWRRVGDAPLCRLCSHRSSRYVPFATAMHQRSTGI